MNNFKEFYKGKAVLLSGVTGFLGKVILEKMLRSLPTIRKIYVMIRPRKN
jgi:thioester reductase-like protein